MTALALDLRPKAWKLPMHFKPIHSFLAAIFSRLIMPKGTPEINKIASPFNDYEKNPGRKPNSKIGHHGTNQEEHPLDGNLPGSASLQHHDLPLDSKPCATLTEGLPKVSPSHKFARGISTA